MIEDVFGKPALTSVINDCILFFKNGEYFYIGKIYIFNRTSFLDVIKFGEIWISDKIFNGKKIAGYFSTSNSRICILNEKPSRIIGKVGKKITCLIEDINFVKDNQSISSEYCAHIKFEANDLKYNFDKK
jgi:hypothetical protein